MINLKNFSETLIDKYKFYENQILKWNNHTDLISKSDEKHLFQRHILNALQLLPFLKNNDKYVYDIGTGAGFPGLVCAIYDPQRHYVLYEKKYQKRVFLKHIMIHLNLKNVEIKENFSENIFNKCDVLTSRGLLDLNYCIELKLKIKKIVLFKGKMYNNEIIILNQIKEKNIVKIVKGYDNDSFFLMR